MPDSALNFTRGINRKPVSTDLLERTLQHIAELAGECFFGYPRFKTLELGQMAYEAAVSGKKWTELHEHANGHART